ncbi:MAG: 3-ketoacyl-ACP reductase [Planctomycetes bacterium]|nr:3-ketoacyl-ACP reductase [Planctomycetota bacterium]
MSEESKAVLITGASRGIGRAIALRLAELGWGAGLNFLHNREAAEEAALEVRARGAEAVLCPGDVADAGGRAGILKTFKEAFGRIDALVNNAGMAPRRRADLLEAEEESFDEVIATNLKGPYFLTRDAARWMIEIRQSHPGRPLHIVNISSLSEYTSSPQRGEYCLAKAAVGMMTRLFADRLAEHGIAVNEIRPGIIATDMTAPVKEKYDRLIQEGLTPIRRWGQPEDVARAVGAVLGGEFPFTTGAAFDVDGGFHIRRL